MAGEDAPEPRGKLQIRRRWLAAAETVNIRLSILFIVLVVVPTSILSIMAATSVRRWEAMASVRREREAVRLVRAARNAVDAELRNTLARVRERLAVSLAAGRTGEELKVQASRAEAESPCVDRVHVFMNPWGFLLPGEGGGRGSATSPETAALEGVIRRELVAGGRPDWVPVNVGEQAYVFGVMGEGGGLHVGFKVRQAAAAAFARSVIASGADSDMVVTVSHTAGDAASATDDVIVSDPLGTAIRIRDDRDVAGRQTVLAEARLAPPLQHVVVRVAGTAAPEGGEAASIRTRFLLWGVVLLGAAIVAGVWITLGAVRAEVVRSRNQSDLVLGVSHDLRTPVASIHALAESLSLGRVTDPEKQKRFMTSILREAERLGHLTERVLYLLRFEQGAISLAHGSVDLRSLVEEAVNLLLLRHGLVANPGGDCSARGRIGQAHVTVRWTISSQSMVADGDASALLQAVSNLLDNAWQYAVGPRLAGGVEGATQAGVPRAAHPAGAEAIIEVRAEPAVPGSGLGQRKGLLLVVADNGIGMREGERRRLFRRFYRTPEARQLHTSGVGLGLAFSRYVVRAHGGTIEVRSEFGKGSEFTVWLPCARGEDADERG